jgi:hypothetical protein
VPRHPQGHLLVDLQQRRIGVCAHQVVEYPGHPGEQLAGALQRGDGVGEVRRRRVVLDRDDLGGVIGEGLLEGGQEMFRLDLGEGRRLERRLPRLQKRVCLSRRGGRRLLVFRHLNSRFGARSVEESISRGGPFLGLLRLIGRAFS